MIVAGPGGYLMGSVIGGVIGAVSNAVIFDTVLAAAGGIIMCATQFSFFKPPETDPLVRFTHEVKNMGSENNFKGR